MVHKAGVLLRIQQFQQCGRHVSPVIAAGFVDLIQQDQRIADAGIPNRRDDPPRNCAYVSPPVSPDFRFVPDAAQADAHVFFA